MIVADVSALVEVVLFSSVSAAVAARLRDAAEKIHVPYLADLEVASILRQYAITAPTRH